MIKSKIIQFVNSDRYKIIMCMNNVTRTYSDINHNPRRNKKIKKGK